MKDYTRVIPRDLFNEAGLLKSLGRLAIALGETDSHNASFAQDQLDSFNVSQNPSDGSFEVTNLDLIIHGKRWALRRSLNSRASYGLWAVLGDEEVDVLEEDGSLTEDFLELIGVQKDA